MLGSIYNEGVRVPQDYKLAISWYQKAAEQGAPIALLNLGAMYAKGQGVPQSYKDCYFWFILAAAKGDQEVRQEAQKGRGLCEAKLTPSSIEEVQERAAGYFEKF
jgi:uncharacterized protein